MMTNELNLPKPFVDAVTSDYTPKEGRYSVTRVLGGTCEAILLKRHHEELGGDVAQNVWAIFGSAVHKILEESQETETQIKENWLSVPVTEGYELSGIFDLYDDETGVVTDYKTASIWKVKFNDFTDWRRQTLLYCWMLRKLGFNARRGEVVALLKDHSKREARLKASEGYPQHPVMVIGWDFDESDFYTAEVQVTEWFEKVAQQEQVPDFMLEPCTPDQRWHKNDKWAVMEKGKKRALRLLDSLEDAVRWAENRGMDTEHGKYFIEFREGEDTKCDGYCDVAAWCPFAQKKQKNQKSS